MAWVSIDDQFHDHPKAEQVGPLGRDLFVAGLEYANRNLTDGFIPKATAGRLVSFFEIPGIGVTVNPYDVVQLLLDAGMWHEVEGGFQIHDYLDFQPSSAEVERRREQKRERQQRWREKQAAQQDDPSKEDSASQDADGDASVDALRDAPRDAQTQVPSPKSQEPKSRRPKTGKPAARAAPAEVPAALVDAYCQVRDQPFPDDAGPFVNIAKGLIRRGYTSADVEGCTRYMLTDPYWADRLTFKAVASHLPEWVQNGRPTQAPQRPRNGRTREPDFSGIDAFSETMDRLERSR